MSYLASVYLNIIMVDVLKWLKKSNLIFNGKLVTITVIVNLVAVTPIRSEKNWETIHQNLAQYLLDKYQSSFITVKTFYWTNHFMTHFSFRLWEGKCYIIPCVIGYGSNLYFIRLIPMMFFIFKLLLIGN